MQHGKSGTNFIKKAGQRSIIITDENIPPRKYSKNWSVVKLKLEAFKPSSSFLRKTIKSSSIKSIGIVAYGRDHQAKIDISEIYFIK